VVVEANIVRAVPAATRDVPLARPTAPEIFPRAIPLPEAGSNGSGGSWPLQPEPPLPMPPPRPQREALSALADDLADHPVAPVPATAPTAPVPPRNRAAPTPRPEPRVPAPPADNEAADLADQSLAEMAQRLEAALRKPKAAEPRDAAAAASSTPAAEPETGTTFPAPPPRPARPAEAKPARADTKAKEGSKVYDTLEQEMASLLGRPAGKI
jgi:hypothetical protein